MLHREEERTEQLSDLSQVSMDESERSKKRMQK